MSVLYATIYPTKEEEEQSMESRPTTNQYLETMKAKYDGLIDQKDATIANLEKIITNYSAKLRQIQDALCEDHYYNDFTDKDEVLASLCEILDYEPKKEVYYRAVIEITGRCDVPLGEDVSEFLENLEFSTDVYNGDAIVENDSIIEIEESN